MSDTLTGKKIGKYLIKEKLGSGGMAPPIFELLHAADGRSVSLFGDYKAEAGQRPEIILPQAAALGLDAATVKKVLVPGQLVRILSAGYTGKVGKIKHIYNRLQSTPIGLKTPGVDVELPNGEVLFVPAANLDVIV